MKSIAIGCCGFFCLSPFAFGDDFETIEGKEYKDAKVSRVEPDGIVLTTSSGISKVYFAELPKEVQDRFHYDAKKATAYSAEQAANYAAVEKQQAEKRAEVTAKNNAYFAEQETVKNQRNNVQALQDRYAALQQEEDNLSAQLAQAETAQSVARSVRYRTGSRYYSDPLEAQIPRLRNRLDEAREKKRDIKQQLKEAQRQK